jgi:hypothetical protein
MLARAFDVLDRRALALLTFVDALGAPVLSPVTVRGEGVSLFVKRPGALVVSGAPGLATYAAAFDPVPPAPGVGSVEVELDIRPSDPALGARRFVLGLPRDPDPANAALATSLFQPVEVPLLPTPLASPTGLAAALAVTVRRADDGRRVEGALVRLRPEGGRPEARAFTDAAGDALLLVPGVPLASPGAGAVVRPDIGADLDAVIDPALARFHRAEDVEAARDAARRRGTGFIDPDTLPANAGVSIAPAQSVRIEAGRTRIATIAWTP